MEAERENLSAALADAENANADLENRLAAANNALATVKAELERRLREKEDELESLRYVSVSTNSQTLTELFSAPYALSIAKYMMRSV